MLAIQEKKLKEAIAILSLVGAKYKVITPDGAEYGDLEVKVLRPETTKNGLPRYKFGETRDFFRGDISTMKAGDVKVIDADRCAAALQGGTDLPVMQGCLGAIGQQIQTAAEILNDREGALGLAALLSAMQQLSERDR